jgi:hypothetical protein
LNTKSSKILCKLTIINGIPKMNLHIGEIFYVVLSTKRANIFAVTIPNTRNNWLNVPRMPLIYIGAIYFTNNGHNEL